MRLRVAPPLPWQRVARGVRGRRPTSGRHRLLRMRQRRKQAPIAMRSSKLVITASQYLLHYARIPRRLLLSSMGCAERRGGWKLKLLVLQPLSARAVAPFETREAQPRRRTALRAVERRVQPLLAATDAPCVATCLIHVFVQSLELWCDISPAKACNLHLPLRLRRRGVSGCAGRRQHLSFRDGAVLNKSCLPGMQVT